MSSSSREWKEFLKFAPKLVSTDGRDPRMQPSGEVTEGKDGYGCGGAIRGGGIPGKWGKKQELYKPEKFKPK